MTGTRIWALGTTIVIVAVLALGYLLGVSPMLARLAAAEQELASTEATNQAQSATLEVMKAQFEDLDELQTDLKALRVAIPGTIDSDFLYALLRNYQELTAANVSEITTGEAQPYGMAAGGEAAAPAPAPTTESTDGAAPTATPTDPAATGVAAIPNLYTIPVTITITETPPSQVLAFVALMQRGPRLFLVTSVAGSDGVGDSGGSSTTITAYMFVLADPNATADDAALALAERPFDPTLFAQPLGKKPAGAPTPTPAPTESDAPDTEATPTPTPTP